MIEEYAALVAAVQAGTRRTPPPRATDLALTEDGEGAVLRELGALALLRRAGGRGAATTPLPPAPPETRPVADVADALAEALDGHLPAAIEWAREAAARGFVAPPENVADLVPLAARHPEFVPVLGERGRWLAGLMDAAPPEEPEDEADLTPKEEARRIATGPEDRERFEAALRHRRKEVREAAAERLVRIPESEAARTLRALALSAVAPPNLAPPRPEDLPKWLPRTAYLPDAGLLGLALYDLVRHVPPSTWGLSPEDLLAQGDATEYAGVLRGAWGDAAIRFGDGGMLDLLFRRETGYRRHLLASAVSDEGFEAALLPLLAEADSIAAYPLLESRRTPFSLALSEAMARTVREKYAPAADLAYRLDPAVLPLLEAPGEETETIRPRWASILRLRTRLLRSLA